MDKGLSRCTECTPWVAGQRRRPPNSQPAARFQHDWRRPRFIATVSSAQTRRASNCALLANPAIAFLSTDKVVGNLLSGMSTGYCNPIPPSLLVIVEDMRPRTLNSRLSFEGHSIAAGCVA